VPVRFADRLERHQVAFYLAALAGGVLIGAVAPGADTAFEALIYPVLGVLLYATFLQVPFTALRDAFADRRFLLAALGLNFVLVPPIAFALSRLAPGGTAVELGVLLVLLTPCIDYVIVFTRLAGGSDRTLLAAAPLLLLAPTQASAFAIAWTRRRAARRPDCCIPCAKRQRASGVLAGWSAASSTRGCGPSWRCVPARCAKTYSAWSSGAGDGRSIRLFGARADRVKVVRA